MKLEATVISDILYVYDQGKVRKFHHKLCLWQSWTVIIKGLGSVKTCSTSI